MSAIVWDDVGARLYEVGVDRGVLYVDGQDGVPWNGLTEVAEKATGGTATPYYVDGEKYLNTSSPEEYGATISAFTYPDEFMVCDGTALVDTGLYIAHQPRKPFSFTYRSKIGNDAQGQDFAYKIHLIYNAMAEPSESDYKSLTESPDPITFSWNITLQPPQITGFKSTGHYIFDSRTAHPGALAQLEQLLYGTDDPDGDGTETGTDPTMPDLPTLLSIIAANANISVVDNGDGTFTLTADDDALTVTDDTYDVNSNAVTTDGNTLTISTN